MANFVDPQVVRDYLQATGTIGQWSNSLLGSNIAAASNWLQKKTNRQFEPQGSNLAVTKTFSTYGQESIVIPDLRSASAVTLNGNAVTANSTYYLIPDRNNSGVFVGVRFPQERRTGWGGLNTFDINYNHLRWGARYDPLPNNVTITGVWGHEPLPPELLLATTQLAGYYTLQSDTLLSGARQTPEGNVFDLSKIPGTVREFIAEWKIEETLVVV